MYLLESVGKFASDGVKVEIAPDLFSMLVISAITKSESVKICASTSEILHALKSFFAIGNVAVRRVSPPETVSLLP